MERSNFLSSLHMATKDLKGFLTNNGRRWLTNLIALGRDADHAGGTIETDRIYEILCFFSMVSDLSRSVDLRCVEANGPNGYRVPYGPAEKHRFSFFRFEFEGEWFDLCCGTGVPNGQGSLEHPDVSLQRVDSESASNTPGELVAIWDGKYHRQGKRLEKPDIAQMNMWFDVLLVPPCASGDVLEKLFSRVFHVCSVITNAPQSVDYRGLMLTKGFSTVLEFVGPGTGIGPDPSRAEHTSGVLAGTSGS